MGRVSEYWRERSLNRDYSPPEATPQMQAENRAKIAREFSVSKIYRFKEKRLADYQFWYIGKEGKFHKFEERRGGWTVSLTDAQLVGMKVEAIQP